MCHYANEIKNKTPLERSETPLHAQHAPLERAVRDTP